MVTRRTVLTGIPCIAAVTVATDSYGAEGTKIELHAPDDVFVKEIYVTNANVSKGQKLISLHSPSLERIQARLVAFEKQLDIVERPLIDGRADAEIRVIAQKAKMLEEVQAESERIAKHEKNRYLAGLSTTEEVHQANVSYISAKTALLDATIHLDQAKARLSDAKDRLLEARNALSHERDFISTMMNSLLVISPTDGYFKASTIDGAFIRKGEPFGEFQK